MSLVSLRAKILVGNAVTIVVMGVLVAWSLWHVMSLGQASDAILSENYLSVSAADYMLADLERLNAALLLSMRADASPSADEVRLREGTFLTWLERAEANITLPGEAELVQRIGRDFGAFSDAVATMIEDSVDAPPPLPHRDYESSIEPLLAPVRESLAHLRRLNEEAMESASARAGGIARRAVTSMTIVALAAVLLAGLISVYRADRITLPLRLLVGATKRVAAGDFAVHVSPAGGDDIGRLATEFNHMASQLATYRELHIDEIVVQEQKLAAVIAGIEDGMLFFDRQLNVTDVNQAARRMLDLDDREFSGRPCASVLPFPEVCDAIAHSIATGEPPIVTDRERMVVFMSRNGLRDFQLAVTPIAGRDEQTAGAVLLLRDLTALIDVERVKSEFVTAASHELRSPLTSLQMSVDLLLERVAVQLAERDRELLEAAHEEVQRMKSVVNDLLDLSRIEAGRIEMAVSDVSVRTLFEQVQEIFRSQAEAKGVALTTEPSGDWPTVRADAHKATWVLTNLVSNALRYVGPEGHIRLSARRSGTFAQVSVADDGPGIPAEVRERIFEKFVHAREDPGAGSGLGLAISKEIVRAHGGTIWVESSAGRGSTFTFTLPLAT